MARRFLMRSEAGNALLALLLPLAFVVLLIAIAHLGVDSQMQDEPFLFFVR